MIYSDGLMPTLKATDYKGPLKILIHKRTHKIVQIGNTSTSKSYSGNPTVGRTYIPAGLAPTLNTGGGGTWYVARRRRAAAILDTLAAGYSSFSFWLKDGGALYIDGVKGRYVSTTEFSTEPTSPAFDLRLTTKQAKKLLDRAGYACLD
ncbi:hypothetical protein ME801_04680 [Lactobacillus delbrueckii]|nr:hypothetical protein ME801_04680 [Lactobacillus delbrueckii]